MQVWSGGHDARLCAVNAQCRTAYMVGDLKGSDVAQAGGIKAMHRVGYNVWVFGIKAVQVYSAHSVTDKVSDKVRGSDAPLPGFWSLPCGMTLLLATTRTRTLLAVSCSRAVKVLVRAQLQKANKDNQSLQGSLKDEKATVATQKRALADMSNARKDEQAKWDDLAAQQQAVLIKTKLERDDATAEARARQQRVRFCMQDIVLTEHACVYTSASSQSKSSGDIYMVAIFECCWAGCTLQTIRQRLAPRGALTDRRTGG